MTPHRDHWTLPAALVHLHFFLLILQMRMLGMGVCRWGNVLLKIYRTRKKPLVMF